MCPLPTLPKREDRGLPVPDRCPGSFPAGQVAAEASEAENQCGSLKMDALIVAAPAPEGNAAWRRSHPARWGQWLSPAQVLEGTSGLRGVGWSQWGLGML